MAVSPPTSRASSAAGSPTRPHRSTLSPPRDGRSPSPRRSLPKGASPAKASRRDVVVQRTGENKAFDFEVAQGWATDEDGAPRGGLSVFASDVGSRARIAGLKPSDRIVAVDGVPLPTGERDVDIVQIPAVPPLFFE